MKGGMGNMMKQAQQMQAKMAQAQEEIAQLELTGSAGGSLVQVVMTGKHEVKRVTIADDVFEDDKEMLEDLLAAAVNDAVRQLEETSAQRMSGIMPAGMSLPF